MINDIKENLRALKELFDGVLATNGAGIAFSLDEALQNSINMIVEQAKGGGETFVYRQRRQCRYCQPHGN